MRIQTTAWSLFAAALGGLFALLPAAAPAATYEAPSHHPVGRGPSGLAIGDFNGDTDPDLAVPNTEDGTVSVLLGAASGSFQPQVTYPVAQGPRAIATADFNADGDPDLVSANANNTISVLLGAVGGSFGAQTSFASDVFAWSIAVADFNGDGDPDLAVAGSVMAGAAQDIEQSGRVMILAGGPGGSFGAPTTVSLGGKPGGIVAGDFNGDSDPDLAVTSQHTVFSPSDSVSVLLGGAGATFAAPTAYTVGADPISIAIGNFDSDADPDLASANRSGSVSVLHGATGGTFANLATHVSGADPAAISVGDVNGDGTHDLVVANGGPRTASVLVQDIAGGFRSPASYDLGGSNARASAIGTGDFNTDGDLDIAAATAPTGSTAPGQASVLVGLPPASPAASLSARDLVLTDEAVSFKAANASSHGDPVEDDVTRYEWDLDGDGSYEQDTGPVDTATHTYAEAGVRTASVRLTTTAGLTATASRTVDVRATPPGGSGGGSGGGQQGVTINRGAQFTNDPQVVVSAVWPPGAINMLLSNDGGFGHYKTTPVQPDTPWTLQSSGPERLPKTIYVRFEANGSTFPQTFQDDIILDETPPELTDVSIADGGAKRASKGSTVSLHIEARDKTSGVSDMQVTNKKSKPGDWKRFKAKTKFQSHGSKVFVRVRDKAGNRSRWKRAS